jgi:hypothetical protein
MKRQLNGFINVLHRPVESAAKSRRWHHKVFHPAVIPQFVSVDLPRPSCAKQSNAYLPAWSLPPCAAMNIATADRQ